MTGRAAYLAVCQESEPPVLPMAAFVDNIDRTAVYLRHCTVRPQQARAIAACMQVRRRRVNGRGAVVDARMGCQRDLPLCGCSCPAV